ncbi:alginate lyase family protein [Candidatus Poribacteria bacterium]
MKHPILQEDQIKAISSTIQSELRPMLLHLEKTLTGTLSQQRFDEISGFLQAEQTPLVFSEQRAAWSPEQVSDRLIQIIICLAKLQKTDIKTAGIFLRGIVEHAEYLYAFNKGGSHAQVRASLGLSLAGVVCHTIELSDMWRLASFSRFATEYTRSPIVLEQENIRNVFMASVDLAIENQIPVLQPAIYIYEEATGETLERANGSHFELSDEEYFGQLNLDHPGIEDVKTAFTNGEIEEAKRAYVNYLTQIHRISPEYFRPAQYDVMDADEADEICQNTLFLRAHSARKHNYGKEVDWTTVLDNDIETNVSINGHQHLVGLAEAYRNTGDEKYAHHLARLWDSWYRQSPCPDVRKSLQWRTLECGVRTSMRWPRIWYQGAKSQEVRDKILFNMAVCYLEHARYLSTHQAAGGNWFQVETSGLGAAAVLFPEWKESERFFQLALRRLRWSNDRAFFPDGFQTECSTLYHIFPYRTMGNFYAFAKAKGRELPREFVYEFERTTAPLVYIPQPDFDLPLLNDCNPFYYSASNYIGIASEFFQREDFRYIRTKGNEGSPPGETSYAFPHAGYYVMRDRWDASSSYLVFDAGYYGAGHQHEDKLSFALYAHGRPLIIDPGIYQYVRDDFEQYFRSSRGHNSVMVDGKGQRRGLKLYKEEIPDPNTRWISQHEFDFAEGWYKDGFSSRLGNERDMENLEENIHQKRSIFHPRGEYFILHDVIIGDGLRKLEQIFHLAPVLEGVSPIELTRGDVSILENSVVRTDNPQYADIAIVPVQPKVITNVQDVCGQTDPYVAGWMSLHGKQPSHDITYVRESALPLSFDVVLMPLRPGEDHIPTVKEVPVEAEVSATAFYVEGADFMDLFLLSEDGASQMKVDDVEFSGELLYMRFTPQRELRKAVFINGRTLKFSGKRLVDLPDVVESWVLTTDL